MQKLSQLSHIKTKYVRIPSEQISAEQQHLVQLDCAAPKALSFIRGKGNDRGYLVGKDPEIGHFLKQIDSLILSNDGKPSHNFFRTQSDYSVKR